MINVGNRQTYNGTIIKTELLQNQSVNLCAQNSRERYDRCELRHAKDKSISAYRRPLPLNLSENHSNNNQTWSKTRGHLTYREEGEGAK